MSEHPYATLYRKVTEALMEGDLNAMADSLADDVVWHQIGAPTLHGKAAVVSQWEGITEGVEFDVAVHDVVANDEHLVGLVEAHVKVGDDEFSYKTAEIAHMDNGKVTERWAFSDDTQAIVEFFSRSG